ncbi:MAG: hypothetical protein ACYCZY_09585 [Lacisediminihabitans sp.]
MRAALLLLVLALDGCAAPGERAPAADSAAIASSPADVPAPGAPVANPAAPASGDSSCEAVRALAERTLRVTLARDTAPTFAAPRNLGRWRGCRYTGRFTVTAWTDTVPENMLDAAMRRAGWAPHEDFTADGPADTELAWARGDHLCHVSLVTAADVEPDAPVDTLSRVPIPYEIELRCTSPVPNVSS